MSANGTPNADQVGMLIAMNDELRERITVLELHARTVSRALITQVSINESTMDALTNMGFDPYTEAEE